MKKNSVKTKDGMELELVLDPDASRIDALLLERLDACPINAETLIRILLINHFAVNGGIGLSREEQERIAEICPQSAKKTN